MPQTGRAKELKNDRSNLKSKVQREVAAVVNGNNGKWKVDTFVSGNDWIVMDATGRATIYTPDKGSMAYEPETGRNYHVPASDVNNDYPDPYKFTRVFAQGSGRVFTGIPNGPPQTKDAEAAAQAARAFVAVLVGGRPSLPPEFVAVEVEAEAEAPATPTAAEALAAAAVYGAAPPLPGFAAVPNDNTEGAHTLFVLPVSGLPPSAAGLALEIPPTLAPRAFGWSTGGFDLNDEFAFGGGGGGPYAASVASPELRPAPERMTPTQSAAASPRWLSPVAPPAPWLEPIPMMEEAVVSVGGRNFSDPVLTPDDMRMSDMLALDDDMRIRPSRLNDEDDEDEDDEDEEDEDEEDEDADEAGDD